MRMKPLCAIMLTVLASLCVLFAGCTPQENAPAAAAAKPTATPTPQDAQQDTAVKVKLTTSKGNIVIALNEKAAPISTANFLRYVDDKRYDGTIFHRVIKGFMIQGGGFTPTMQKINTYGPIKNEASNGLKNLRGTIAMARTAAPDSATCQFFINHRDNASLNPGGVSPDGYAVFGKVIEGMDVVDAIATAPTGVKGRYRDVPRETVVIVSAERVQ